MYLIIEILGRVCRRSEFIIARSLRLELRNNRGNNSVNHSEFCSTFDNNRLHFRKCDARRHRSDKSQFGLSRQATLQVADRRTESLEDRCGIPFQGILDKCDFENVIKFVNTDYNENASNKSFAELNFLKETRRTGRAYLFVP